MATKTIFTPESNIDEVLPDWRSSGFFRAAFPFYCRRVPLISSEVELSGSGSRFSWRASLCGAADRAAGGQGDGAERGETTTAVTLREVQPGSSDTSTCHHCSFHTGRVESI